MKKKLSQTQAVGFGLRPEAEIFPAQQLSTESNLVLASGSGSDHESQKFIKAEKK